jgi:hypothetical protein
MYEVPQSVFNPFCQRGAEYKASVSRVLVTEWPDQTEAQTEQLNAKNMTIKEITPKTRLALRLKRIQREEEERLAKLRQPKRVQRRKEIEIQETQEHFNVYLDMGAISRDIGLSNQQIHQQEHHQVAAFVE